MLPELSRAFGVGLSQAAQVVSWFAVVYGLAQLIYGPLGDRHGKFRVVLMATVVCGVGNALTLWADGLSGVVAARMLAAAGAAAIIPLSMAWIGDTVPYARRQETLARLSLGTTLGLTMGQLLGGVFTDTLGWQWAFGFMAGVFFAVAAALWRDLRRQATADPAPPAGVHLAAPLAQAAAHPSAPATAAPGFASQTQRILSRTWPRWILGVAVLEGVLGFGVLALWASHLHERLGLTLAAAGGIVALFGLGGMAYMASASRLIPRLKEHGLAGGGVLLFAAAALVVAFCPAWAWALPASLFGGFGFFMFHNTLQTNATQLAPEARGTAMSLFAVFLFTGQSLGVWAAAAAAQVWGSTATVAAGGLGLALVGGGLALRLRAKG